MTKNPEAVRRILCVSHKDATEGPMLKLAVFQFFEGLGLHPIIESAASAENTNGFLMPVNAISAVTFFGINPSEHTPRSILGVHPLVGPDGFNMIICTDMSKAELLQERYAVPADLIVPLDTNPEPLPIESVDAFETHLTEIISHVNEVLGDWFELKSAC